MYEKSFVSIIISDLENSSSLPRLLQSIARQSDGLNKVEVLVVGKGDHPHTSENSWATITGHHFTQLLNTDKHATIASARNKGEALARGEFLLFLRPSDRLDPKYLTTVHSVMGNYPDADIIYSNYIRMAGKQSGARPGMITLPSFDPALLQKQSILCPTPLIRHTTFDATSRFRDNTLYFDWDINLQLSSIGAGFYHIDYPLVSCEHTKISFQERAEDGRNKALLVLNNPAHFHEQTTRWALAYLRGDSWAQAFNFMSIPSALDVTSMLNAYNMKCMGADSMAQKAIHQFENLPETIKAMS